MSSLGIRGGTWCAIAVAAVVWAGMLTASAQQGGRSSIGREVGVPSHLHDDEEFKVPLKELLEHGKVLFTANWTDQEGAGRPFQKGTGKDLADPSRPLIGLRAFNRISGPDANSCAACHNAPYGLPGGGGDFVTNVFVQGQRFDFASFDPTNKLPTSGGINEGREPVTLQSIANSRSSTALFGAGYLEMLAREITADLHAIRDSMKIGDTRELVAKGISFGRLTWKKDGMWDMSEVTGLPRLSILAPMPVDRPSLVIRPWHQVSNVVSLREFANNAYPHHHGIQTTERFGIDTDPDGDGFTNEMTRADVTAVSVWQATLQVPGRVIPNDREIEKAVLVGEAVFERIGCATCHIPALPLTKPGWIYTEPNPYNPATNLRPGDARPFRVDLADPALPLPRLAAEASRPDVIMVPAYTDFKLHDITDPNNPDEAEPLDQNQTVWSPKFRQGNRRFLTKRLWGAANEAPYFHHGLFTTMRQAVLGHSGEALAQRKAFQHLSPYEQDALVEFLKTLQVLPPGTKDLIVDEHFRKRQWPPAFTTDAEAGRR